MESSEVLHTIGKQTASDTVWYDRDCANARAGARERTRVQHLAQHLKQQSPNMLCALPLSMHQQSKDGSSFTALGRTGKRGRMELRRSEEQFRWIAAPLNCSLTREHTAVEVYIGGLTHHWQANSFRHGMV